MAQHLSPKIAVSIVLLVAGFAVLFSVGLKGSLVYYLTVSEFLDRQGHEDLGDNYRVNGRVVQGSIDKNRDRLGARFLMKDMSGGGRELPVVYARETPDTFVDGAEVVVEGALGHDGVFQAHTLLAKCPSKYESQNRGAGEPGKPAGGYGSPAPSDPATVSQ